MKIVVCIRQDLQGDISPFDACAYEAALSIEGADITLLSMGPPKTEEFLKKLTRLGASDAVLLCDTAFAGADTLATAYALSLAIKKINPDLVKLANAVIKATKTGFRFQLKSTSLSNALKAGKREQMLNIMQKCFNANRKLYNDDMALTGVTVEEVEDSFFDDKDDDFIKAQLKVLIDFAAINTVVESRMMSLLSASCEKALGVPLNKIKFFTNQDVILELDEDEEETEE